MKKPFKNPFRHHRAKNRNKPRGYSPTQIICVSFVIVIALGTLLLSLPIASRYGRMRVIDAMFTATSATCVTGLVVRDTWTQFTVFGQAVILVLIQVGGLGLVTLTSFFALAMRRRMGFRDLRVLGESVSADGYAQAKDVLRIVVGLAACFEGAGILLLMLAFVPQFGLQGIWISIFTAISAFCNAGFDLFGQFGAYSSLVPYVHNYYVQAVVMFMIIAGGLGFMVWVELIQYPKKRKLSLHARVVLIFSVLLWVGGAALIGLMEWNNPASMGGLSVSDKIMASLFQSVSTRTAGMNTIDLAACGPITKLLMSVLQFIGAAPGSTGGGRVTEQPLKRYTVRISRDGNTFLVVNTYKPQSPDEDSTTRIVIKRWDDAGYEQKRPDTITVTLLKDGTVYDTRTISRTDSWQYTWSGLPRYSPDGTEIVWTIQENAVPGYISSIRETGDTTSTQNGSTLYLQSNSSRPGKQIPLLQETAPTPLLPISALKLLSIPRHSKYLSVPRKDSRLKNNL